MCSYGMKGIVNVGFRNVLDVEVRAFFLFESAGVVVLSLSQDSAPQGPRIQTIFR